MQAKREESPQGRNPQQDRALERLLLLRLAKQLSKTVGELLHGPRPLSDREFAEWKALWVFEYQLAEWLEEERKRGAPDD